MRRPCERTSPGDASGGSEPCPPPSSRATDRALVKEAEGTDRHREE